MRAVGESVVARSAGAGRAHDEFEFRSTADAQMWKEVEALVYFHPRQQDLLDPIKATVDEFGLPEILYRGDRIYVGIPKVDAQCLLACHPARRPGAPVGVVLYVRTRTEVLSILHVAVGPAYERSGPYGDRELALCLVNEVRNVARRVSGIRRVQLPYSGDLYLSV